MTLLALCKTIENWPSSVAIAESEWMFPTIETVHVLALTLVVGTIAMLDLRILGVATRRLHVMQLSGEVLPWTWGAFVVAALTGLLMFTSAATKYFNNIPFRLKLCLLAAAGINMAILHVTTWRAVHNWGHTLPSPRAARLAATLSLVFWVAVVFAGRWIGFVK